MSIIVDGRDMLPPEPLEHVLNALELMPAGGELLLLLYCRPAPLFDLLRRDGWVWQESVQPDGTHEIRISKG